MSNKRGRPAIKRDPEIAELVRKLATSGVNQEEIASHIGISDNTMRKLYKAELEKGSILANAEVGNKLFELCMEGNVSALIFWAKTRMGWRETQKIDVSNEDGSMSPIPQAVRVVFVKAKDGKPVD